MHVSTTAERAVAAARRSVLLCWAVVLAGCGGSDKGADDAAAAASMASATPIPAASLQPVTLTESDVEHFIAAMKDLQRLGVQARTDLGSDPSRAESMVQGLRMNAEALGILRQHTFDLPRFQQVGYSVMMAAAAGEMKASAASGDDMAAKLEEMKSKLPPEQYEAMKQMTAAASASMQAMSQQPEGNVALVARYRDQIKALSEGR